MPSRRDEWLRGRAPHELLFCVVCQRHMSPIAWKEHEHNPDVRHPDADRIALLDSLMGDVVYLGGLKVTNCASVVVAEGVEVFRLRDRDSRNHIRIDLDLRGPQGKRVASVQDNRPVFLSPGYAFEEDGPFCGVFDETGRPVFTAEALSSKAVQLLGTFWAGTLKAELQEEHLDLGGVPVQPGVTSGKGTAIVLRKGSVGFAKR